MAKANKKAEAAATPVQEAAPAAGVGETQTTTSLEPVQLTIADLQLLGRIIDLASRRGAFQAGELSQVGDAFNKLSSFLAYVDSQTKEATAAEEAETPVASAEATAE